MFMSLCAHFLQAALPLTMCGNVCVCVRALAVCGMSVVNLRWIGRARHRQPAVV